MKRINLLMLSSLLVASGFAACAHAQAQPALPQAPQMTFFVTSTGLGKGGDLGGLEGADAHCQKLGTSVGAGHHSWRAYLSTQAVDGKPAVNARERIGRGPWHNFEGTLIAENVEQLHAADNPLGPLNSLTERGTRIPTIGFTPNYHDILTGSQPDGRAFVEQTDKTCRNWTSSSTGQAIVGHLDKRGLHDNASSRSWNSAHPTRGCGAAELLITAGSGLFYCFAHK